MSLNPHRMYFKPMRQSLRFLMSEFSPLEVSLWVNMLNLNFKDTLIPLGLSCISHIHQIKVDEPLLHTATEFWIPTGHVFQFNVSRPKSMEHEFRCMTNLLNLYDSMNIINPK